MGCRCEALGEGAGTSGRGLTRIFRAKRRLVSRAFVTLAEGRTGEQEKHRPRCVGGGGADGRAERPRPASWADLYRLRDRNSDALHSFMCLVRTSVGRLSRPSLPSLPTPFISLSLAEKLLLRASIPFPCPPSPPSPASFHAISGRERKSHDAENINERRRRDDARAVADAGVMTSSERESARVFTDSNRGGR